MMKKKQSILLVCMGLFSILGCNQLKPENRKFVIILQAGTEGHEGMARALHALLYAKELKDGGHPIVLIFDGAGTTWAEAMRKPDHMFHAKFVELEKSGIVEEVCDYCSGAFKVKDQLRKQGGVPFSSDFGGHPSIKKWVDQGYEIIVL